MDLLPLTVPEIRHVLWAVGQAISAEATALVFYLVGVATASWGARQALPLPAPPGALVTYLQL